MTTIGRKCEKEEGGFVKMNVYNLICPGGEGPGERRTDLDKLKKSDIIAFVINNDIIRNRPASRPAFVNNYETMD